MREEEEIKVLDDKLKTLYLKQCSGSSEGSIGAFYRFAIKELGKMGIIKSTEEVKDMINLQLRTEFIINYAKSNEDPVDPSKIHKELKRNHFIGISMIEIIRILEKYRIKIIKPIQLSDPNSSGLDLIDGETLKSLRIAFGVKPKTLNNILSGIKTEDDKKLSINDVYRRIWKLRNVSGLSFENMSIQFGVSQNVAKKVYYSVDRALSEEQKIQIKKEEPLNGEGRFSKETEGVFANLDGIIPANLNGRIRPENRKLVPEEIIVFLKESGLTNIEISIFFDDLGISVSETLIGRRYRNASNKSREEAREIQQTVKGIILASEEKLDLTKAENKYYTAVNRWKNVANITENSNRGEESLEELNRRLEVLREQKKITAELLASYLTYHEKQR